MSWNGPIADWLFVEGRRAPHTGALLQRLCERLIASGVPVARATTHIRTLHPEFRGVSRIWRRGESVEEVTPPHGIESTAAFRGSPLEHVIRTGDWIDRRLDRAGIEFRFLAELRADGFTHYVMAPLVFSDGTVNAISFASDAPGGFAPEHLALLREIMPTLCLVVESFALRRISTELLSTYVGRDPGRRIMAGAVRRGELTHICAAIMLTDMRGFTAFADELPEGDVVTLLNDYFDCVVPPVKAEGGEVLKFIGDGVLSVFRTDGAAGAACAAALRAGTAAIDALARRAGGVPLETDVALHWGVVGYGNIGAGDRLDYTVIGRDVNLVDRLEQLCRPLDRHLLMSAEFGREVDAPIEHIGHFAIKGFREMRAVYGLRMPEPG